MITFAVMLAQGDGGEQRGGGQERGRQVQRCVQRAGEGRVPGLDDFASGRFPVLELPWGRDADPVSITLSTYC